MTIRTRTLLKALHWTMVPLFTWFILVQPADVARVGSWAIKFHSVMGLAFVTLALVWAGWLVGRGLQSRPGPKLRGWARAIHRPLHLTLIWGMFAVALTGFLLGLTSARMLFAGTLVPIAPPLGLAQANHWVGLVHSIEFYGLAVIALGHAAFHTWRHVRLRDNALRIMAPRFLHRWL